MAAVLVVSCSFATEYTVVVRAHTYMRDEIRRNDFTAPGGEILTLYVLPNVELTTAVDLLSGEAKGGLLVEVPSALPAGDTSISLALDVEVTLRNTDNAGSFPDQRLTVFLAPRDAEIVYVEGQAVAELESAEIPPGREDTLVLAATLSNQDQAYSYLTEGALRVGVALALQEPPAVSLTGAYEIDRVDIAITGYPQRLAARRILE
jgi:hypothetical protein